MNYNYDNEPDDLISIIVPVYNVEKYLRKGIESILNQTYKNLEVIIIDDGSTDNSGIICDEYANADKRIHVIHQENKGVARARNAGLKLAGGKYIGFIDPDDYIDEKMFEILYRNIKDKDSDIAICSIYRVETNGVQRLWYQKFDEEKIIEGEDVFKRFADDTFGGMVWNKLFKRDIIRHYFPDMRSGEDVCWLMKIFLDVQKISYINQPLYFYIKRKESLTLTDKIHINGYIEIYKIKNRIFTFISEARGDCIKYFIKEYLLTILGVLEKLIFDKSNKDFVKKLRAEINNYKKYLKYSYDFSFSKKIKLYAALYCMPLFYFIVIYERYMSKIERKCRKIKKIWRK